MAWIDDVVSHTTIRSVWGNSIRNRVVHQYASIAERNAASDAGHAVSGMQAWADAEQTLAIWVPVRGWMVLYQPWQSGWVVTGTVGNQAAPVQADIALYRRTGDLVTVRFIVKITPNTQPGTVRFTLPIANATPEAWPYGTGSATDYYTAQTFGVTFVVEFQSMYARRLSDWSSVDSFGSAQTSFEGQFTYVASAVN